MTELSAAEVAEIRERLDGNGYTHDAEVIRLCGTIDAMRAKIERLEAENAELAMRDCPSAQV